LKPLPASQWTESYNFYWIKRIWERICWENISFLSWYQCLTLTECHVVTVAWMPWIKISIDIILHQIHKNSPLAMQSRNCVSIIAKTRDYLCIWICTLILLPKATLLSETPYTNSYSRLKVSSFLNCFLRIVLVFNSNNVSFLANIWKPRIAMRKSVKKAVVEWYFTSSLDWFILILWSVAII